jgi:hypothetical protein
MAQAEPGAAGRAPRRFAAFATALAAGIVGGLFAPLILPGLARGLRPAAKSTFKTALAVYERGRETAAELGEMASDIFAEARAEHEAEQNPPPAAVGAAGAREVVQLRGGRRDDLGLPDA